MLTIAACESSNDPGADPHEAGRAGAGSSSGGQAGRPHDDVGGAGRATNAGTAGQAGRDPGRAGTGSGEDGDAGAGRGGEPGRGAAGSGGDGGDRNQGGEGNQGGGGGEDAAAPGVAYISTFIGDLLVASLDPESGAPTLLPSSPIAVDGFSHGVAVSPDARFLFVPAQPARIDTYPIAVDGSLPTEPSSSAEVDDDNPMLSVALDPLGRFAYGVSPFSQTVYAFTIEPASGALTLSGDPISIGTPPDHRAPAFVGPAPSGRFVYVTQMAAGPAPDDGIRAYRVDQTNGRLTELAESPFQAGNVVAGAVVFTPDGKFMFTSGGGVNAFKVDTESGKLELVAGSPFSLDVQSDAWAPNLAIDPEGKLLYASNFALTRHVSGFAIDPESGALSPVPGSPASTPSPYSLALGPGGRFLYVGDDTGQISVFRVARPSGRLVELDDSPFPFGGLEADFAFVSLR